MTKKVKDAIAKQNARRGIPALVLPWFFRLIMFSVVIAPVLLGVYTLWQNALADSRFHMNGETLAMAGAIRECPESVNALSGIGRAFDGRSLLDPRLLFELQAAYEKSIWIKKVTRLKRFFPNRVEVEFHLRMPAAQVRYGKRYWLVDSDAVLLPTPESATPFESLPEIVGATADVVGKPPKVGVAWDDAGVSGALGVMRCFWTSPLSSALPIDRVVVIGGVFNDKDGHPRERTKRFEVVTTSGTVVRWGSYNEGDLPGELTSGEKMWHLQELMRHEDALRPGICFDVRTRKPGFTLLEQQDD